jgi:hypothetical protein
VRVVRAWRRVCSTGRWARRGGRAGHVLVAARLVHSTNLVRPMSAVSAMSPGDAPRINSEIVESVTWARTGGGVPAYATRAGETQASTCPVAIAVIGVAAGGHTRREGAGTCLAVPACSKYNGVQSFTLSLYSVGCMTALGTTTVHLLTAVLLVCPYLCLSNAATGACSTRGKRPGGCACCSRSVPQDSKDCPNQPDSRQGNGTCLCHGAVMDRIVQMPNPDHEFARGLPSDIGVPVGRPFRLDNGFCTERAACHFPAAESAREVRALIASLLL